MERESNGGILFLGGTLIVVFFAFLASGFSAIIKENTAHKRVEQSLLPLSNAEIRSRAENDSSYFFGPENAEVTVVEFLDFQCPFCEQAYPTVKTLLERYRGRSVKFAFRHFPIEPIHPVAMDAARAAECAKEQNRFLEMHDALYERQGDIALASLPSFAQTAGVPDMTRFASCVASRAPDSRIRKDFADGRAIGVSGTPTFFINGQKLEGAQELSVFTDIIDRALDNRSLPTVQPYQKLPTTRIE